MWDLFSCGGGCGKEVGDWPPAGVFVASRNIDIGTVKDAIVVNYFYEEGDAGAFPPLLEEVTIENMTVDTAKRPFVLRGYNHTPIAGITLNNVTFKHVKDDGIIENVASLSINNVTVNGLPFSHSE